MSPTVPFGSRSFQMSWKEAAIALIAGLGLAALLVGWWRSSDETAPDEAVQMTAQARLAPPVIPTPVVRPAPTASAAGLVLYGVLGGDGDRAAVIIGDATSQRLVRVGREVAPGVRLRSVDATGAMLMEGDHAVRISLADAAGRSSLTPVSEGVPSAAAGTAAYRSREAPDETREFRLGVVPRSENGAITGFVIRPDNEVPIFAKAGLRPGDVITTVNGRAFASERELDGLSREIAVSSTLVIGYERNGQRLESRVDIAK